MGLPGFKDLCSPLLQSEETQAKVMVDYLKDVSAMLCLIAALREKNIEAHLQQSGCSFRSALLLGMTITPGVCLSSTSIPQMSS